jgi:hypothetical protein
MGMIGIEVKGIACPAVEARSGLASHGVADPVTCKQACRPQKNIAVTKQSQRGNAIED